MPTTAQFPERGLPLQQAWRHYAPEDLRRALSQQFEGLDPQQNHSALDLMKQVAKLGSHQQYHKRAAEQAIESLRRRLAIGELWATGLPPPVDGKFARANIESAFWDAATIAPDSDAVSCMGVHYRAVEVLDCSSRDAALSSVKLPAMDQPTAAHESPAPQVGQAPEAKAGPGGRTNHSRRAKDLAQKLWSEDESFRNMSRRFQAQEIRARMFGEKSRRDDNMSGCTTDSLKRWIGEVLPGKRTDEGPA